MTTKSVKTVLSSHNHALKVQKGGGTNHNQFALKVRNSLHPNHNQSALKVLKGFRIMNHNQSVLKMK